MTDALTPEIAKPERQYGAGDPEAVKPKKQKTLTAREVLAEVREVAKRRGSAAILVEQDPLLTRLVAVWPSVCPGKLPRDAACPIKMELPMKIRWLWAMLPGDPIAVWLRLAGLPDADHTRRACWVAIENLIVLPNGSISPKIKSLIEGLASRAKGRVMTG